MIKLSVICLQLACSFLASFIQSRSSALTGDREWPYDALQARQINVKSPQVEFIGQKLQFGHSKSNDHESFKPNAPTDHHDKDSTRAIKDQAFDDDARLYVLMFSSDADKHTMRSQCVKDLISNKNLCESKLNQFRHDLFMDVRKSESKGGVSEDILSGVSAQLTRHCLAAVTKKCQVNSQEDFTDFPPPQLAGLFSSTKRRYAGDDLLPWQLRMLNPKGYTQWRTKAPYSDDFFYKSDSRVLEPERAGYMGSGATVYVLDVYLSEDDPVFDKFVPDKLKPLQVNDPNSNQILPINSTIAQHGAQVTSTISDIGFGVAPYANVRYCSPWQYDFYLKCLAAICEHVKLSATPGVFSVSMFYPENTDTLMEAYKLLAKTNLGALIVASGNEGSNSTIALYPQHMPPFMGVAGVAALFVAEAFALNPEVYVNSKYTHLRLMASAERSVQEKGWQRIYKPIVQKIHWISQWDIHFNAMAAVANSMTPLSEYCVGGQNKMLYDLHDAMFGKKLRLRCGLQKKQDLAKDKRRRIFSQIGQQL